MRMHTRTASLSLCREIAARPSLPPPSRRRSLALPAFPFPSPPETISRTQERALPAEEPEAGSIPVELGWRDDFASQYSVQQPIGQGSFGEVGGANRNCLARVSRHEPRQGAPVQVHLGIHRRSHQEVAVRTMLKVRGKLSRAETLERIRTEVGLMGRVQGCPGVVELIECFEDAKCVKLIIEVCHGGDLRKYVEDNGPMNERALALVANEVVKFIKACHTQDLFYGDIKPANFCLKNIAPFDDDDSSHSHLKAIDFGTSQDMAGGQRLTKRHGTLVFMAPEVYGQNYGPKAELWSMGVMLYWLFSQRLPFWESGQEPRVPVVILMAAISSAPIRYDYGPWLSMSPEGLDFVKKCLEREEEARMGVDDALQHPWLVRIVSEEECEDTQCAIPIIGSMNPKNSVDGGA